MKIPQNLKKRIAYLALAASLSAPCISPVMPVYAIEMSDIQGLSASEGKTAYSYLKEYYGDDFDGYFGEGLTEDGFAKAWEEHYSEFSTDLSMGSFGNVGYYMSDDAKKYSSGSSEGSTEGSGESSTEKKDESSGSGDTSGSGTLTADSIKNLTAADGAKAYTRFRLLWGDEKFKEMFGDDVSEAGFAKAWEENYDSFRMDLVQGFYPNVSEYIKDDVKKYSKEYPGGTAEDGSNAGDEDMSFINYWGSDDLANPEFAYKMYYDWKSDAGLQYKDADGNWKTASKEDFMKVWADFYAEYRGSDFTDSQLSSYLQQKLQQDIGEEAKKEDEKKPESSDEDVNWDWILPLNVPANFSAKNTAGKAAGLSLVICQQFGLAIFIIGLAGFFLSMKDDNPNLKEKSLRGLLVGAFLVSIYSTMSWLISIT